MNSPACVCAWMRAPRPDRPVVRQLHPLCVDLPADPGSLSRPLLPSHEGADGRPLSPEPWPSTGVFRDRLASQPSQPSQPVTMGARVTVVELGSGSFFLSLSSPPPLPERWEGRKSCWLLGIPAQATRHAEAPLSPIHGARTAREKLIVATLLLDARARKHARDMGWRVLTVPMKRRQDDPKWP